MDRSLSGPTANRVVSAAVDTVTSLIELAVGAGCAIGGIAIFRSRRWIGVVLVIAGLVAIVHAVGALMSIPRGLV
jgi:hypothetical protein